MALFDLYVGKEIEIGSLDKFELFVKAFGEAEKRGEKDFTCPMCGGHAFWGRSAYNGHLHMGCKDCGYKIYE